MWLPDGGLKGFMHFKILGVDSLPPANNKFSRYVDVEIGKGRHSLRTTPVHTVCVPPSLVYPASVKVQRRSCAYTYEHKHVHSYLHLHVLICICIQAHMYTCMLKCVSQQPKLQYCQVAVPRVCIFTCDGKRDAHVHTACRLRNSALRLARSSS